MARTKNALTGYYIQKISDTNKEKANNNEWLELAKWISTVEDASNEETDSTGYYDGDGTPTDDVISHQLGYAFTGLYDDEDAAMSVIESMIGKVGENRKIWFKVVKPDGTKERSGKATVKEPIAQVGDATAFGTFSCTVTFDNVTSWKEVQGVQK
ncbi:phage tail tube protein [Floricoccus penangensis]|uniref:phage tail tube protein n=1 Tax=Floricoccus penangensis TaxID=1859475 RepID=UPI00203DC837|nr:phage tail protein [Floricoccus penangensis]URZ87553.1 phage tail protein [Floricoccus penangensis]